MRIWARAFPVEGTAGAKSPRQERAPHVPGREGRPGRLGAVNEGQGWSGRSAWPPEELVLVTNSGVRLGAGGLESWESSRQNG